MNQFASIGTLQFIGVGISALLMTAGVLFFLLRGSKSFIAIDGTRFSSKELCDSYEVVLKTANRLYSSKEAGDNQVVTDQKFGFQTGFLKLLKDDGFPDAKTLLKYKDDFGKLLNMLTESKSSESG